MTVTEKKPIPSSWSILERHPELDLKELTLPWSIHIHQDEWKKGEIRPILTALLRLSIRSISFSGLNEGNISEALAERATLAPYNARFVYEDDKRLLSEPTRKLINTTEGNTRKNKPGLKVTFFPEPSKAELMIDPGSSKLSEDYLVKKIVAFGREQKQKNERGSFV